MWNHLKTMKIFSRFVGGDIRVCKGLGINFKQTGFRSVGIFGLYFSAEKILSIVFSHF